MREKRRNQSEDSDTDVIGPALPQKVMLSHKELGTQLLPGEGEMVYNFIYRPRVICTVFQ